MQDVLRDAEDHDLANTISHFCNCLLGNIQTVSNKGGSNSALSKNQKKVQRKREMIVITPYGYLLLLPLVRYHVEVLLN